jgi:hypothetical protein
VLAAPLLEVSRKKRPRRRKRPRKKRPNMRTTMMKMIMPKRPPLPLFWLSPLAR